MSHSNLQHENAELRTKVERLSDEREQYRTLYLGLLEKCARLEAGLLGQKRERFQQSDAQLTLDVLGALLGGGDPSPPEDDESSDGPTDDTQDQARTRRQAKRRRLPENLPRIEVIVRPPEVEREGLDAFELIGEEVSEVVERRRASLVVVRTRRQKYVRKSQVAQAGDSAELGADTQHEALPELGANAEGLENHDTPTSAVTADGEPASVAHASTAVESTDGCGSAVSGEPVVLIAGPPELPIPRGLAGPGMLADTIVSRWQDHLPLHRLEQVYRRDGLELARSTICGWHMQLAELCRPLIDTMWTEALGQPYLCTDATGVLVQAKEKCRRAHFWVVVAPELHVLFGYSRHADSAAVDRLLGGYEGYLVADAATVYDHLYADGRVVEVGCWAHARRYFFKALSSEPERAGVALGLIRALFRIEREIADKGRQKRQTTRHKKSKPLVTRFFAWCDEQHPHLLDDTPIKRAVGYARNQRKALERFLEDGKLPIHNNWSEGALRREAVGRKNWLFVGSDDGAEANAVFTTLLASCQLHGIEPWAYLRDLLCVLPGWPVQRVLELAPAYWRRTLDESDLAQRLADNPYRALTEPERPASAVPQELTQPS